MKKLLILLSLFTIGICGVYAQPRIVDKKPAPEPPAIAPESFKVKYEGGMFGFSRKLPGTVKFDDANLRFVFFNTEGKEQFGIPYKSIIMVYPSTQSVQSTTGKVVQNIPIIGAGILGQFMTTKLCYMVVSFDDPDMEAKGAINFKVDKTELLRSAVETLGNKAEMQKRGDAFYRPIKKTETEKPLILN